MLFLLDKQLRAEKSIISELKDKIKQSKTIKYYGPFDGGELFHEYRIDDLILKFHVVPGECLLIVDDKAGKEIVCIKYESWYPDNKKPRYRWVNRLHNIAKKHYEKLHADEIKRKKLKEAQKALEMTTKIKKQQQTQLNSTLKALQKIQGL